MWRLKKSLTDSVVFLNKKINFCKDAIRCTVNEMWGHGDRVACGSITTETKVVFRSTTAMVYLFIQMSSEMWDFDMYGDLYFEKAVNGFLYELFSKWQKTGASHEVTIVMFSRTFYAAKDLSEFPSHMHECLQQDYKGRFYEDFYRVVVQNEKFEDWFPTLTLLRQTFTDYKKLVMEYHEREGITCPPATNSTASQGNFLEVLNISLNVFEKHFINRNLDRTGQQAIVITPGVGIFEVDRDLTVITKQRIIDSGVGSDLICVGEQPLHAVPLFKMHTRVSGESGQGARQEDYSMPHWMNLSFYATNRKIGYSSFIPRIKLPNLKEKHLSLESAKALTCHFPDSVSSLLLPDSPFAYDEYDAQVFTIPPQRGSVKRQSSKNRKSISGSQGNISSPTKQRLNSGSWRVSVDQDKEMSSRSRIGSMDDSVLVGVGPRSSSSAISIPTPRNEVNKDIGKGSVGVPDLYSKSFGGEFKKQGGSHLKVGLRLDLSSSPGKNSLDDDPLAEDQAEIPAEQKPVFGSTGSQFDHSHVKNYLLRPGRALVNPFDPSHVTVKLTSNRRRWTHIFPKGPTQQQLPASNESPEGSNSSTVVASTPVRPVNDTTLKRISDVSVSTVKICASERAGSGCDVIRGTRLLQNIHHQHGGQIVTEGCSLAWGEQQLSWDASLKTGVDWKSITYPACLPITTDYFPDKRSFNNDLVLNQYRLVPDELNADYSPRSPMQKAPLSTKEVFLELVSQRLAQGFQLIIHPRTETSTNMLDTTGMSTPQSMSTSVLGNLAVPSSGQKRISVASKGGGPLEPCEQYWLSIGRNFHHLSLTGGQIDVIMYRPRHPYPARDYLYRYRFMAPDNDTYEVSWVEFNQEKLENYGWNYLDHYVSTRGDQDYVLSENLKYWRFRMYVLPLKPMVPFTERIKAGSVPGGRCDVYQKLSREDGINLAEGFLRFLETCVNKIKRPNNTSSELYRKKSRCNTMGVGDLKPPGHLRSLFRERVGSNKGMETGRGRDRMVSSPLHVRPVERSRTESGSGAQREAAGGIQQIEPLIKPLTGSQDSVFGSEGGMVGGQSAIESQADQKDFKLLRNTCTLLEILEAFRNPSTGLSFLSGQPGKSPILLPPTTFVSGEAVLWLMEHVEGMVGEQEAIEKMQEMVANNMIRHTSGNPHHPFVYGFYLYYLIVGTEKEQKETTSQQYNGDTEAFRQDWVEVALEHFRPEQEENPAQPSSCCENSAGFAVDFLQETIRRCSGNAKDFNKPSGKGRVNGCSFKSFTVDADTNCKSDRSEWGEGKYQSKYRPDRAFEMRINWSVATGAIVTELVSNWARKAQSNGLSIIPIPGDPFALPSQNSDPIRGPIFIPLDTECLREEESSHLFQKFSEDSWEQRLFLFRESIVKRFGFIACTTVPTQQKSSTTFSTHHQYIHCTGNCFILIPTRLELLPGILGVRQAKKSVFCQAQVSMGSPFGSPQDSGGIQNKVTKDKISRHPAGLEGKVAYSHDETGFLWSWNFMISKRWRTMASTGATGDIPFMDKLLADFRRFCNNEDNRLASYWKECLEITRNVVDNEMEL